MHVGESADLPSVGLGWRTNPQMEQSSMNASRAQPSQFTQGLKGDDNLCWMRLINRLWLKLFFGLTLAGSGQIKARCLHNVQDVDHNFTLASWPLAEQKATCPTWKVVAGFASVAKLQQRQLLNTVKVGMHYRITTCSGHVGHTQLLNWDNQPTPVVVVTLQFHVWIPKHYANTVIEVVLWIASEYFEEGLKNLYPLENVANLPEDMCFVRVDDNFQYGQNFAKTDRFLVYHPPMRIKMVQVRTRTHISNRTFWIDSTRVGSDRIFSQ